MELHSEKDSFADFSGITFDFGIAGCCSRH